MHMLVSLALATAGGARLAAQGSPSPQPHQVLVDLSKTKAEVMTRLPVPTGRALWIDIHRRLPGFAYRVALKGGLDQTRILDPARLEPSEMEALRSPRCAEAASVVTELFALPDEYKIEPLLERGMRLPQCSMTHSGRILALSSVLSVFRAEALREGESLALLIERLDPASGAVVRTFRLELTTTGRIGAAWKYPNETAWLFDQVVRDLTEMVSFGTPAARGPLPVVTLGPIEAGSMDGLKAKVEGPGTRPVDAVVPTKEGPWSPSAYEGLISELLRRSPRKVPRKQTSQPRVLERLIDSRASVMEEINREISRALADDLRLAAPHAQAALLLGVLGLREAAGGMSDPRGTLCRMTAHLALARALRQGAPSDLEGELAEATLETLAVRQRDAVARLDRLAPQASTGEVRAFWNALRLRNTADWRILPKPLETSLLERLEHARALGVSLGRLHSLAFFRSRNMEPVPDWGRQVLDRIPPGGDEVLTFLPGSLDREFAEAREVHRLHLGREAPPAVAEALDAAPGRAVSANGVWRASPQVIDWGSWGRFYQRHILNALARVHAHLGLPEARPSGLPISEENRAAMESWTLYPLTQSRVAQGQSGNREDFCPGPAALAETSPELFTGWSRRAMARCANSAYAAALGDLGKWFDPPVPAGSALEVDGRLPRLDLADAALIERLYAQAPLQETIVTAWRWSSAGRGREETPIEADYGALAEYNLAAMKIRAGRNKWTDPDGYRRRFWPICEIDADSCLELGEYLATRGRKEEAAAAYQKAVADGLDRSLVGSKSEWLIGYYADQGRTEEALKLALAAGQSGTKAGMLSLAGLLERLGRFRSAEEIQLTLPEPHPELRAFYDRWTKQLDDGRCRSRTRTEEIFPDGPRSVDAATLSGRPEVGLTVTAPQTWGFKPLDVLVALDGYRVSNPVEYRCIARFSDGSERTALVWRGGKYVEITGPFGVEDPQLVLTVYRRRP